MIKNIIILFLLGITSYVLIDRALETHTKETQTPVSNSKEAIVFIRDVQKDECTALAPLSIEVSHDVDMYSYIARFLFEDELASYGTFANATLSEKELLITLTSDKRPDMRPISSLSSCEVGHLQAVLNTTFGQFDDVDAVYLYSPEGILEF